MNSWSLYWLVSFIQFVKTVKTSFCQVKESLLKFWKSDTHYSISLKLDVKLSSSFSNLNSFSKFGGGFDFISSITDSILSVFVFRLWVKESIFYSSLWCLSVIRTISFKSFSWFSQCLIDCCFKLSMSARTLGSVDGFANGGNPKEISFISEKSQNIFELALEVLASLFSIFWVEDTSDLMIIDSWYSIFAICFSMLLIPQYRNRSPFTRL